MTEVENTLLVEELINECEIELDMERDSEKMVEQRNRRIADDKKRFEESQQPGNSTSVRKMYPRGSATRQAAPNTTATSFRPLRGENLRNDENSQNQVEVDRETKTLRGYGGGGEP